MIDNRSGFSLIELLITMTIVSVGMLGLGSFYLTSIDSERTSQERLAAVHIAEQLIEDWQQLNVRPTPDCTVAGVAAAQLVAGTTITACVPNDGVKVPFDILINERSALAPIPSGHLNHTGASANPEIGELLVDPTNAASAIVKLRSVKISWTIKGKTRSVFLTHIQRPV